LLLRVEMRHVLEAKKRLDGLVRETPFINSPVLSEKMGASVYLKLENMHPIGAFKIRGAANKMLSLTEYEKKRGVTTFSTGNHGLAVAYVAKHIGIKAVICISNRVPDAKVERIQSLGAEIKKVGNSQDEAESYAYQLEKDYGLTVIKPFDDPYVIAGQGTIALEMMGHVPYLDTVIVQVSGGGLFSGIGLVLKHYNPNIRLIGVAMENSAVMYKSLQVNHPVVLEEKETLADSLLGGIGLHNEYTFSMVKQYIDDFILVSEAEIKEGMAFIADQHRFIVEGAAATGVAAILSNKLKIKGSHIGTVITGNNVDTAVITKILQEWIHA